jgi:hypothetical protein
VRRFDLDAEPPAEVRGVSGEIVVPDAPPRDRHMKKPSKTAAELEASIKVEMEDISDSPTEMMISVRPDGDSWIAVIVQGSGDDPDRCQMIEQIAARLKAEYDLKN